MFLVDVVSYTSIFLMFSDFGCKITKNPRNALTFRGDFFFEHVIAKLYETSAVEPLRIIDTKDAPVYSLSGQRLTALRKGYVCYTGNFER